MQVAAQLFGVLARIEVYPGRLGLDVADHLMRAIPDAEVGVTGLSLLGQDGDLRGFALHLSEGFQQVLQGRVVTLLGGVAALGEVSDGVEVGGQ